MRKSAGSSSLSLHGGGGLESECAVAAEGAVTAGVAVENMGSPSPPNNNEEMVAHASAAVVLGESKRSGPSGIGQPLTVVAAQERQGDRINVRSTDRPSVGFSVQQRPPGAGQEGAQGRIVTGGVTRETDAAAGEKEAGQDPSGASTSGDQGVSEAGGLAPPLKLSLPWDDDDGGPGLKASRESGGGSVESPIATAAAASGGGTSARSLGTGGLAAAGLTYPGGRPVSAPQLRPSINGGKLNATSPILSGRRFEGTSVGTDRDNLGGSRSLGRTAGASLAGRLMSYATRPGGTFDVFAAARDGQVGRGRARARVDFSRHCCADWGGWTRCKD